MTTVDAHPLADVFPMMDDEQFEELKKRIDQYGQRVPILMFEGKILDGRNRKKACQELNKPCRETQFTGDAEEAWEYIWDLNVTRRNLTAGQRARAAEKHANLPTGAHPPKVGTAYLPDTKPATTQSQAAKKAGVSESAVRKVRTVRTKGTPEVDDLLARGKISISLAERLVKLPEDRQRELAALPAAEIAKAMPGAPKRAAKKTQTRPAPPRAKTTAEDVPGIMNDALGIQSSAKLKTIGLNVTLLRKQGEDQLRQWSLLLAERQAELTELANLLKKARNK